MAEALVREYLAKNHLESTLKKFESERPRGTDSITNRNALRKQVFEFVSLARKNYYSPSLNVNPKLWLFGTLFMLFHGLN